MSRKAVIWSLVGVAAVALGAYTYIQVKRAMQYCYKIVSFAPIKVSVDKIVLGINVWFLNKSDFGATVNGYDFDVYLNNVYLSRVSDSKGFEFKANTSFTIPITVEFAPKKVFNLQNITLMLAAFKPDSPAKLKMVGKVRATLLGFIPVTAPFTYESTIKELMADDPNPPVCP